MQNVSYYISSLPPPSLWISKCGKRKKISLAPHHFCKVWIRDFEISASHHQFDHTPARVYFGDSTEKCSHCYKNEKIMRSLSSKLLSCLRTDKSNHILIYFHASENFNQQIPQNRIGDKYNIISTRAFCRYIIWLVTCLQRKKINSI